MTVQVKIGKHDVSGTAAEIAMVLFTLEQQRIDQAQRAEQDDQDARVEHARVARARAKSSKKSARAKAKSTAKNGTKPGKKMSKKTGKRSGPAKSWTPALVKEFCSGVAPRVRETIAAGMKAGGGADSNAIAKMTGWPMAGVGKRVMKAVTESLAFSKSLPPPIQFIGDRGDRVLSVDTSFLVASGGTAL